MKNLKILTSNLLAVRTVDDVENFTMNKFDFAGKTDETSSKWWRWEILHFSKLKLLSLLVAGCDDEKLIYYMRKIHSRCWLIARWRSQVAHTRGRLSVPRTSEKWWTFPCFEYFPPISTWLSLTSNSSVRILTFFTDRRFQRLAKIVGHRTHGTRRSWSESGTHLRKMRSREKPTFSTINSFNSNWNSESD